MLLDKSDEPTTRASGPAVFTLGDELLERLAALRPLYATFQGVAGHDSEWGDLSPEGHVVVAGVLRDAREKLRALPPSIDRFACLATAVTEDFIDMELDRLAHRDHLRDLNHLDSTFQHMRMVFDVMDRSTPEAWNDLITRLETIDAACRGYQACLDEGRREGLAVAARQVRSAIEQGRVHAGESSFFHTLPAALEKAGIRDSALSDRLTRAVTHACRAFADLTDYLEQTYLPAAPLRDPVGRDRYLREARRFLGMGFDPIETYAWGFREIRQITEQMRRVGERIAPGKSLAEVLSLLKTDPARSAAGPEDLVQFVRERQARAFSGLSGVHFDIPDPVRRLEVELAPAGSTLGAYYMLPSDGFKRPGTIWYIPPENAPIPLYDQVSTAYHEGFPGHHLQCGIQVALTDQLSRLHRVAATGYAGYAEGWALYAEKLMGELGYYEKDDYEFGMLICQLLRACRVVIDIGSHLELPIPADSPFHPGEAWTYALGVEMLETLGGLPHDYAESEMTRYLGWPGQAISYKVGERVMLELREELRRRQGAAFCPKAFHAKVLGCGSVGLSLLREWVLDEGRFAGGS